MAKTVAQVIGHICSDFVSRSESLNYKGAERDTLALEYWVGAVSAIHATEVSDARMVILMLIGEEIAKGGYNVMKDIATSHRKSMERSDEEEKQPA